MMMPASAKSRSNLIICGGVSKHAVSIQQIVLMAASSYPASSMVASLMPSVWSIRMFESNRAIAIRRVRLAGKDAVAAHKNGQPCLAPLLCGRVLDRISGDNLRANSGGLRCRLDASCDLERLGLEQGRRINLTRARDSFNLGHFFIVKFHGNSSHDRPHAKSYRVQCITFRQLSRPIHAPPA